MKRKEILRRLEERLARGEITEKTYLEIKARYDAEPEEPEEVPEAMPGPGDIGAAVETAVAQATQAAQRAIGEAMRAVEFSGIGTTLSDEVIRIVGSGVVSGNPVRTTEFKSAGSAKVQGPLQAETARVAGSCQCDGDVTVEEFRSAGSTRIAGSLKAEQVESSGSLLVQGDIVAEDITTSGSLQVQGKVHAEDFRSSGSIRIDGGLEAQDVRIDLGGSSRVSTVRAQDIEVKATGGFFRVRGELVAERIEGKDVYLEATSASFVKGQDVRIGPHCRIEVVEAQDLVVHESSEVKERRAQPS